MAFGQEDGDLRLAFGRLDKALESLGDMKNVVFARVYSLTNADGREAAATARRVLRPGSATCNHIADV